MWRNIYNTAFFLRITFVLALGLFIFQNSSAQKERKFIRKGTEQYKEGKFLESEIEYRRALDKDQGSFEGNFNLGNALFKQEKADEALGQYEKVAASETNPVTSAKIYHNIGNVHFVKQEYEKSIDAYKKALRQNPSDDETRYNLIAAQKMLKQQQDQKQQQQNQEQKEDQKKQQEQQEKQKQQQEQQKEQQKQQSNPSQMTKQDAERLLNAIQQDESELQEKLKKVNAAQRAKIEKNW